MFSSKKSTNDNYLELNLITNKYGVVCLNNRMFLISVFGPIGDKKIYESDKLISQFEDYDGNTKCVYHSFQESYILINHKYVYNNFN